MNNSDGAGAYSVAWAIQKVGKPKRYIFNGF
jgi:hypothetical protein